MAVQLQFERDRAYRGLIELILKGETDPEAPLSERKLATSLDIGRTPVREALRDLARDGVLEVRPARGTYVRRLSAEDVREIYEVRVVLEGMAASEAAKKGASEDLRNYVPIFKQMIKHPDHYDPEQTYETGTRFHTDIFQACGNRQLYNIYEPLRLRFRLALGLPVFYDHQRIRESVKEHLDILEAILAGDSNAAQQQISDHLAKGSDARARIFTNLAKSTSPHAVVNLDRFKP